MYIGKTFIEEYKYDGHVFFIYTIYLSKLNKEKEFILFCRYTYSSFFTNNLIFVLSRFCLITNTKLRNSYCEFNSLLRLPHELFNKTNFSIL